VLETGVVTVSVTENRKVHTGVVMHFVPLNRVDRAAGTSRQSIVDMDTGWGK
jgi:hypothetical protein